MFYKLSGGQPLGWGDFRGSAIRVEGLQGAANIGRRDYRGLLIGWSDFRGSAIRVEGLLGSAIWVEGLQGSASRV